MARKRKQQTEDAPGGGPGQATRSRLTPIDVQEKTFRVPFMRRGYHMDDVDEFLDHLTEDLAALYEENKRLRELLEERGGTGLDAVREAELRAEETVRQAREHAARLVAEAERRAGSGATASPGWYLGRERQFLQRLASLVQEHAEGLKREARRVTEEARAEPADEEAGGGAEPASARPAGAATGAPTPVARPAPERPAEAEEAAPGPEPPGSPGSPESPEPAEAEAPEVAEEDRPSEAVPEGDRPEAAERDRAPADDRGEGADRSAPRQIVLPDTVSMDAVEAEDADPLAEWDNPFVEGAGSAGRRPGGPARPRPAEARRGERPPGDEEPSLRELFWGEE